MSQIRTRYSDHHWRVYCHVMTGPAKGLRFNFPVESDNMATAQYLAALKAANAAGLGKPFAKVEYAGTDSDARDYFNVLEKVG